MDKLLVMHTPSKFDPADWDVLTEAVRSLHLEYKLSPARAVPGSPGIVLAFGEAPPFLCEGYVLVPSLPDDDLPEKILTCLENRDNGWVVDPARQLSAMFGVPVTELESEHVGPHFE